MKISVFGAGGVGGYFGARLAQGGAEVHLIARGEHLEALRAEGLRVLSPNGNASLKLPATASPDDIGPSDVVLFCVKSTDTDSAASKLGPLLREDTAVITLQNGVDNEARIADAIGWPRVVGGAAYIMATISEPGVITHEGEVARIVVGEMDGSRSERLERLVALCQRSAVDAQLSENIQIELWRKFAVICATAGMTAAVRLQLGDIRASSAAFETYRRIAEEVVAVARAEGIDLPLDTPQRIVEVTRILPGGWFSSLHYDLTHGKPMELDALHGSVVRLARKHALAAPMCEAVYAILEPWAERNRAG